MPTVWFWVIFNAFVVLAILVDLGFFRDRGEISFRAALVRSAIWVLLAVAFGVLVFYWRGPEKALQFATGYVVEESLSVDNLFVFLTLFTYFGVSRKLQHTVLVWGIVGALIFRGLFIAGGVALLNRFHWIIYVFGAFLIFVGVKMLRSEEVEVEPERNLALKLVRRWLPVTSDFEDGKFLVRREGKLWATPLLVVLIVIETTDILFAVDSVPAVLAISKDPFIVYSSNVFAILGLRALYFALSGLMDAFHHLHYALAAILSFIGIKMLISNWYEIPTHWALLAVLAMLATAMVTSHVFPKKKEQGAAR